jgi:hypothetical protein
MLTFRVPVAWRHLWCVPLSLPNLVRIVRERTRSGQPQASRRASWPGCWLRSHTSPGSEPSPEVWNSSVRIRTLQAKEFSDMITAALARAKRDRPGFVVMCLVALAIIVGFAGIVLMGR